MNVVVSHMSALYFLDMSARLAPPPLYRTAVEHLDGVPHDWAYRAGDLQTFHLDRFRRVGKDLDILVPASSRWRKVKGIAPHAAGGELPPGSFADAGAGVLVCSPPLVFVQLCRSMPLMRCIRLGHFICGVYSKEPSAKSGVVERRLLTTKEELEDYVARARHLRGARNASAALPWILEGAASPMETELVLPFYLPERHGGFGFVAPELNWELQLSEESVQIEGSESLRVDACWPDYRVGLEYNSYAEHGGNARKIGEDERRKLVLLKEKIHVELVTKQQVDDARQLAVLAQMLADYGVPKQVR